MSNTKKGIAVRARFGDIASYSRGDAAGFPSTRRRPDHLELVAADTRLREELKQHRRELEWLREENEIPRQAAEPLIHLAPARERFAFIHRLRGKSSIKRMCRVLVTDRSRAPFAGFVVA
ncbi:hypothetical protein KDK95_30580 [Actinospica sp. MGRD01-02]|uniref:Uncharacterized protein n=1 Tax=Actinospica acidithermotolerans TaxID=2828514 RepID=A0A941EHU9_9ACTN|nr:hypothetical protein [Actinospica acidithermotolerans]MBR7830688.1 hypothetical protein [Actinospica acidithermotolerans]